jgi:multidrug efflux pump subunit AcrB
VIGLVTWFARNPVAANLLAIFIVVAGLLAAFTLRQETIPNVAFDLVRVGVVYPGAAPDEIEEAICVRVEEAIHGVKGIDRLFSEASEGVGAVWARLEVGADPRQVVEEIKNRIDGLDTLPDEAEKPVVQDLIDDSVLLGLAVHGDVDELALRTLGERLRDGISELPEVSRAEMVGVRDYELTIEVSESELRRFGLTFDDVARAVRASSLDLAGGSLKTDAGEILVRAQGRAYRGSEFERLILLTREDGTRLYLGDVSRVIDGFAESDEKVRLNGKPAVVVRVLTSETENVLDISRAVREYADTVRERLPPGVELTRWHDQSLAFESRRALLLKNGAQGLALILLVLALFLRFRLAAWVAAGIPISFLGALVAMAACDVSINMMSLFAFISGLGLIVDDAIIIGENVSRHQRATGDAREGAVAGVVEVAIPVTAAVLTTVLFALPTLSLPTMIGKIAYSLGLVVVACLLFSLVESLFILPAHLASSAAKRPRTETKSQGRVTRLQRRFEGWVERFIQERYRPFLDRCLQWPALTLSLGIAALMITLGGLAGGWVRYSFLPDMEDDWVTARLVMPEGTPPETVEAAVTGIEREAQRLEREVEEEAGGGEIVRNLLVAIGDPPYSHDDMGGGGDGPNVAYVRMGLVPGERRRISSLEIEDRWRDAVGPIPGALSLVFSGSDLGDFAIDISLAGTDRETLKRAAQELAVALAAYPGVHEVADTMSGGKQELALRIRPEAEALGLTLAELARQVRQGFHGEEVQRIQRGRDDVAVVVRYPSEERRSLRNLEDIRIRVPGGAEVPFPAVATAELRRGYSSIERRDRKTQVGVTADVDKAVASAGEIVADLEANVLPGLMERTPGLTYDLFGASREEAEMVDSLMKGWVLALFASYALLAIPLGSYLQPLIILVAIPFGLVGGVLGHYLLGITVSGFSLVGLVALTGVVVNDALVLLDRANRKRREGLDVLESLGEAAMTRFRPILLTSLTTFIGLLPLLFERSAQAAWLKPMAVTLSFGVMFATVITLLLVPAAYVLLERSLAIARGAYPRLFTSVDVPALVER